jgi:hypothetical protein
MGMLSWLECKKEKGEVNLKPILTSRCCRLCSKVFVPLFNIFLYRIKKIPIGKTVAELKGFGKLKLTDFEFRVKWKMNKHKVQ